MESDTTSNAEVGIGGNSVGHLEGKYLTFALCNENYALEILKVQEIIGVIPITAVPKSPEYVKGVINLRGKIIPVVDLRLQLGMPEKEYDDETCFIVVNTMFGADEIQIGIVVDTVLEVVSLAKGQIQPSPEYGASVDTTFIMGLGKVDEQVIILIDIDKALVDDSEELLETAQHQLDIE